MNASPGESGFNESVESLDLKPPSSGERQQHRLLKAHEVLAEPSDENQEQFGSLVETLRAESGTEQGSA